MSACPSLVSQLETAIYAGDMALIRQLTDLLSEAEREPLQNALEKPARRLAADILDRLHRRSGPTQPARLAALNRAFAQSPRHAQDIFAAARLVLIAAGSRVQAEWAFVTIQRRWGTYEDYHKPARDRFSYHATWALAMRPVEWAPKLLFDALTVEGDFIWDTDGPLTAGEELFRGNVISPEILLPSLSRAARRYGLQRLDWSDDFTREVLFASLRGVDARLLGDLFFDQRLEAKFRQAIRAGSPLRSPLFGIVVRRLIEATRAHDANWWAALLGSTSPTPEDWSEHSVALLDLLGASSTRAAGIGIEAAKKLLASGAISPNTLAPALHPALGSEAIGVARGAVELLRAAARKEPSLLYESMAAALQALSHPKPAVSAAILNWLESETRWREDPAVVEEVSEAASTHPEAIASRLRALLPNDAGRGPGSQAEETVDLDGVLAHVRQRLEVEPDPARSAFFGAAAAALEDGTLPPIPPEDQDYWRSGAPFAVPESAEETARLLLKEGRLWSRARNFEALLAGMRVPLTPDEEALIGRMLHRCLRPDASPMPDPWRWPAFWERSELRASSLTFSRRVLDASLHALSAGIDRLPIQTPTHDSGYLAPEIFAERVIGVDEWGELELLELGSALYRLAPGDSARAKAWERLQPALGSLPPPARLALTVALGPESEVEYSGRKLFRWAVEVGFDAADPERVTPLRLLCAAARARYPSSPAPFLHEAIHDVALKPLLTPMNAQLTESLFTYGDGAFECCLPKELRHGSIALWGPSMSDVERELIEQILERQRMVMAQKGMWESLVVFPELASLHPSPSEFTAVESGFNFPSGANLLLQGYAAARTRIWDWEALCAALRVAANEGGPLHSCLSSLQTLGNHERREVREQAIALVQQAYSSGRLTGQDVVDFVAGALRSEDARPRSLLSALVPLTDLHPELRLAASVAALMVLSAGGEKELSGADRTALLEALHGWLAANARGIEDAGAKAAVEALAGAKSASRSRELARLLLRLPHQNGRPSALQMLAVRDVERALSHRHPKVQTT